MLTILDSFSVVRLGPVHINIEKIEYVFLVIENESIGACTLTF